MKRLLKACATKESCLIAVALLVAHISWGVSTIGGEYKSMTVGQANLVALDFSNDLYISSDEGATFTFSASTASVIDGTNENFTELEAFGSTVIAVGVDGLILRSDDDGISWAQANAPFVFGSLYGLAARAQSPDNEWLAVGGNDENGAILRSLDDGENWAVVETLSDISLRDAVWTGNRWLVCGMDEFFFEGVIYNSTNGTTWQTSTLSAGVNPLRALASDGSGVVLAVGEQGQILRSTDDGLNFSEIASQYKGGVDFQAVIVDSSGTFFVGGDEKLIIEIDGSTATTLVPNAETAPTVLDFVLIDDEAVAIGSFPASTARTVPFTVSIAPGGSLDFILFVEETLAGRTYYVETTTDLASGSWTLVSGSTSNGTGASLSFEVSRDEPARFWRIVEF